VVGGGGVGWGGRWGGGGWVGCGVWCRKPNTHQPNGGGCGSWVVVEFWRVGCVVGGVCGGEVVGGARRVFFVVFVVFFVWGVANLERTGGAGTGNRPSGNEPSTVCPSKSRYSRVCTADAARKVWEFGGGAAGRPRDSGESLHTSFWRDSASRFGQRADGAVASGHSGVFARSPEEPLSARIKKRTNIRKAENDQRPESPKKDASSYSTTTSWTCGACPGATMKFEEPTPEIESRCWETWARRPRGPAVSITLKATQGRPSKRSPPSRIR